MKNCLCVFTDSPSAMSSWQALTEDDRLRSQIQGIEAWKQWAERHVTSIIEMGGPLSKTKLVSKSVAS